MRQATKTFVAVLVFGYTLVGAYLGALAVHLVWAFWLIVPVAAVVSLARVTTPRLLDLLTRIRNYPKLLKAAAVSRALDMEPEFERSGAGFDLVAQDEGGSGVTGFGRGQVLAQLRDSGGGAPGW